MGLFSKKAPALDPIEQKAKIKQTVSEMTDFVKKSEEKKLDLLAKAKKAKANGDNASFKLATFGLATTMALKNKVEKMISTIEIMNTMKEVSEMTKGFLGGMEVVCMELSESSKGLNFAGVMKGFNTAMGGVGKMFDGLDTFSDDVTLGFETMGMELDPGLSRQIQDMIESDVLSSEGNIDDLGSEIDKKLRELNKA